MKKVTTTAAAAVETTKAKFVAKEYKNPLPLREKKAASSQRLRDRRAFIAANPGVELPAELSVRTGYQKGLKTKETEGMTEAQISKLEAHRAGKALATKRFHFKKKNPGVALPAELAVAPKVAKEKVVKEAKVVAPKAAKVAKAPLSLEEMVYEKGDVSVKMTPLGKSGYTLRKYSSVDGKKKQVSQTYVKAAELPTSKAAWKAMAVAIA